MYTHTLLHETGHRPPEAISDASGKHRVLHSQLLNRMSLQTGFLIIDSMHAYRKYLGLKGLHLWLPKDPSI